MSMREIVKKLHSGDSISDEELAEAAPFLDQMQKMLALSHRRAKWNKPGNEI